MRDYAKVPPQIWLDKQIKQLGLEAQLIAHYLMTGPHSTMLGIYYLPVVLMAHQINISYEVALQALKGLCRIGYCAYDEEIEYVWVYEMALSQMGGPLKPTDNRVKDINERYQALPKLSFLQQFYEKYKHIFHLELPRDSWSPLQAPSKPLGSQEQDQEKEQKEDQNKDKDKDKKQDQILAVQKLQGNEEKPIETVFAHWKRTMGHLKAVLDPPRRTLIRKALQSGYTVDQLCEAITGCSLTPHNQGENDRGQRYDGLHIIFRNADQIERFIYNAHHPPKLLNPAEKRLQSNIRVAQDWLNKKLGEGVVNE